MGTLCSTREGSIEILPRSLLSYEGGKNEMRHKPRWLLLLTGISSRIYGRTCQTRKKKLLSEAALVHRIVQPVLLHQTQRLAASGCGYRSLRVQ